MTDYNIYCDESCHLENDRIPVMVIGGVWCRTEHAKQLNQEIGKLKQRFGWSSRAELKWNKISNANLHVYLEFIDYFFKSQRLYFRSIVVPKDRLDHKAFNQKHDDFYYKVFYQLFRWFYDVAPSGEQHRFNCYIDYKDTRSSEKIKLLREILEKVTCYAQYNVFPNIQPVRSHEVNLIQLADVMIGAISYSLRELRRNNAKIQIIHRLDQWHGSPFTRESPQKDLNFNIFHFHPRGK